MRKIFEGDFLDGNLSSWTRERRVPDGYSDFVARGGAMAMLDAGNLIFPTIPRLANFSVRGCFETDWDANDNKFSLQIYFDYDRKSRHGSCVDIRSDGKALAVSLAINEKSLEKKDIGGDALGRAAARRRVDFELLVEGRRASLLLDSEMCFSCEIERGGGAIGLGRGAFIGELRMLSFEVASDDPLEEHLIWDGLRIPFEPINGMDDPIIWTVSARRIGDVFRVDVALSGGCVDRKDIEWFPYHGRYKEELAGPYLRIESPGGGASLDLTEKTLNLCQKPDRLFYILGPEKPEWPLARSFWLDSLEHEDAVLFCGYKSYVSRSVNKHQAAGRSETAYDCRRGKVVFCGEAVEPGSAVADLKSPADKKICRAIPTSAHDYGRALRFARENHYFSDGEECRFHFEVLSRMGAAGGELRLERRLLNAFFEPLEKFKAARLRPEREELAPGLARIRSEEVALGKLKPGVYHMEFRLLQGGLPLAEKHRAFEVFSKKGGGPEASGLPKMFSMSNETMGSETDYFDPWKPDCVDVSHYISISTAVMPHFAREKRLWELCGLYRREWFLWLDSRTSKDWDIQKNRDLVENCDYIHFSSPLQDSCLVRLCCRGFYYGGLLDALLAFAEENNFHPEKIRACAEAKTIPDKETFDELVATRFYEWADFFSRRYLEVVSAKKREVAEINSRARHSCYGAVAIYAASYKTVHSTRYVMGLVPSREAMAAYDGFFVFEDYPHACRYSINRGPFLLASMKLEFPKWKFFPEMYTPSGNPCPDAAVARAWPSVGIWEGDFPVDCSVKRALEYVYAAVWHDGRSFQYWRDHGFQTRIWERARYEALLRTWGFVDKAEPARPLKANAFICSEACCLNHGLFYDEHPGSGDWHEPLGDLFNTAEESVAYAYEMSRDAGQNAGFAADFKSLSRLKPDDIDVLVLTPLTKVGPDDLENIRRLHEGGVSLLGFENVRGLEDLFGVREGEICQVRDISVNTTLPSNPLAELARLEERSEHRACRGMYRADCADVLLDGEVPALFANKTKWGRTALFNIPPTVVRRQSQFNRVCYGRDNISELVNESAKLVLRHLSNPAVETDAGKIIGFTDASGDRHIIVEEDAHPMPAKAIRPLLTLRLPGIKREKISCDKDFSIVSMGRGTARIRLSLGPDEFAIVTVRK